MSGLTDVDHTILSELYDWMDNATSYGAIPEQLKEKLRNSPRLHAYLWLKNGELSVRHEGWDGKYPRVYGTKRPKKKWINMFIAEWLKAPME